MIDLISLGKNAKIASAQLNKFSDEKRNAVLVGVAKALRENADYIMQENTVDIQACVKKGVSDAFIDRLKPYIS